MLLAAALGQGRERATILLLLDCSGSMNHPPGDGSRFGKVTAVLEGGLTSLPRQHRVGLWTFPVCSGASDGHDDGVVEVAPFTTGQERLVADRIAALDEPAGANTPLVSTIRQAQTRLLDDPAVPADELKVIMVLTDGENNDPTDPTSLDRLAAELREKEGSENVRIYFVTLERGLDEVRRSRLATDVYDAVDPSSLADAFVDIFESTAGDR